MLALTNTIKFGIHKGDTVAEVIKDDPDWLAWACDNIEWFELDQDAINALDFALMENEEPTGGFL